MIYKKCWHKDSLFTRVFYTGVFLFGFIPIYISKSDFCRKEDF